MEQTSSRRGLGAASARRALRLAAGVPDASHQLAVLKVTADQVTQRWRCWNSNRDALDPSDDSGGEHCRAEAELDQAARRPEEQARTLNTVEEKLESCRRAHAPFVGRCEEITNTQRWPEEAEKEGDRARSTISERR